MTNRSYAFSESAAAQAAFGQRTFADDFPALVPHVRAGMAVVDCGCGNGTITLGIAQAVAPGNVVGFDVAEAAIADATARAAAVNAANVRFVVGNVFDSGLPAGSFDVAVLCGVLGHIPDRERALQHVMSLLRPGGIIAVRDMHKQADWWAGAHSEAVGRFNELVAVLIRGAGGDPFIGGRLKRVLLDNGFVNVVAEPRYSQALSTLSTSVPFVLGRVREPGFIDRIVTSGAATRDELRELGDEIERWSKSPDALYALAECVALGSKPL